MDESEPHDAGAEDSAGEQEHEGIDTMGKPTPGRRAMCRSSGLAPTRIRGPAQAGRVLAHSTSGDAGPDRPGEGLERRLGIRAFRQQLHA